MKYLSNEILKGFDTYKYSSKDTSPVSNYVMHPFWNWLVEFFPRWVAPNLMTLIGFIFTSFNFLMMSYFDPDFTASNVSSKANIPESIWLIVAVLNFLAHQLDGIDGKQARRTGTSTPLGELFDHGCDSWTASLLPLTAISLFGSDSYGVSKWQMYICIWVMVFCFIMSHWEKYLTGILYLPWGYDIGQIGATLGFLVTSICSAAIWKMPVSFSYFTITMARISYLCLIISVLFSVPMTVYNIIQSYRLKTGRMLSLWESTRPLVSTFLLFFFSILWALFSPNEVLMKQTRMFLFLIGTISSNYTVILIIAQMSKTRAPLWNTYVIVYCITVMIIVLFGHTSSIRSSELLILSVECILFCFCHIITACMIVRELCAHFRIQPFSISYKNIATANHDFATHK